MAEKPVGKVEHYYPKVQAAAVKLSGNVKVGDRVHIVGHGDDFQETVTSLQLDHQPIREGRPGQSVGLWVKERVHEGDDVLLVQAAATKAAAARSPKPRARRASKKAAPKPAKRPTRNAKPQRKAATRRAKPKEASKRRSSSKARPRKVARKSARKKR